MRAIKTLGQNFLISTSTIGKIVDYTATCSQLPLVEIGPGKGALTIPLSRKVASLTCIEKDGFLAHELSDILQNSDIANVTVVNKDILTLDIQATFHGPFDIVGSLPFNISKRIIHKFLCTTDPYPKQIFVVVQAEVADKYVATSPKGSSLWATARIYGNAKKIFTIPRFQFVPIPKVDAAFVHFVKNTPPTDHEELSDFIHILFRNPRKQLRNTLRNMLPSGVFSAKTSHDIEHLLSLRAEQLDDDDIKRLFVMYNRGTSDEQ